MIQGVYVANVTPFGRDGGIDTAAYAAHVDWLAGRGVRGIVPFGTNGQGPSISAAEKLPVLERLLELDLSLQIIPCIGQGSLPDTLEMVRALRGHPAEAILVMPPYFFRPAPAEGLKRFYHAVSEAARQPVIVYHIPQFAVAVPPDVVAECDVWGVKARGRRRLWRGGSAHGQDGVVRLGARFVAPVVFRRAWGDNGAWQFHARGDG